MLKDDTGPIWKAMSDTTRRAILDLLKSRERTTGELCEKFPKLSRVNVMKHLDVLEQAGLVLVKREGKFRWNYLNPMPLQEIYERWVRPHQASWATKAFSLKSHIEKQKG